MPHREMGAPHIASKIKIAASHLSKSQLPDEITKPDGYVLRRPDGLALTGLNSMVLAMMPALVWLFYGVAVLTVGFLDYSLWVNRKAPIGSVGLV